MVKCEITSIPQLALESLSTKIPPWAAFDVMMIEEVDDAQYQYCSYSLQKRRDYYQSFLWRCNGTLSTTKF
jgi:hypothetical protein